MIPTHRRPTSPGEMLLEEFLVPLGMSQTTLAAKMGVPVQRVNLLVNGHRAVTAETALLLARVFENSPEFWINLQTSVDLYDARRKMAG